MNEDTLNMSIRAFLKRVGITSQREIELAVRNAVAQGRLGGTERLAVAVRLTCPALGLEHVVEDELKLEG